MTTIPIDIPLPDAIVQRLTPPTCASITIPPPQPVKPLCLPFGGSFQPIVDVTKAIPDDCSLSFSLLLQLPPLLASLGCFIKLLNLVKPLIDIIGGLTALPPDLGKVASAVPDFVKASADIVECFVGIELAVPKFVRDVLHMIAKLLKCIGTELQSIATLMSGLAISIQTAESGGNKALLAQLQCAQANAQAQATAALGSLDMIQAVLSVAEPLLAIAGVQIPTSVPLGSPQGADDVAAAANVMLSIGSSIDSIASTLDALGSC
ncbi:MAG TPA: hypothetical protein VH143_28495 [Kofleriaceae bacterium]|jgi:hypothetical protein|nr:hypothetical protein [Kofleriaceae bacterium]